MCFAHKKKLCLLHLLFDSINYLQFVSNCAESKTSQIKALLLSSGKQYQIKMPLFRNCLCWTKSERKQSEVIEHLTVMNRIYIIQFELTFITHFRYFTCFGHMSSGIMHVVTIANYHWVDKNCYA